jgi:RNA polymerase sigma-70 factor, ECF subfamily
MNSPANPTEKSSLKTSKLEEGKPVTSQPDTSLLVSRLKSGDPAAFSDLVGMFKEKLFRLAYSITLDIEESQDLVQEVFLKAFKGIADFKEESTLATWLHRITVNHCLNWKRRWRRRFKWRHQPLEYEDGEDGPELATETDNPERQYGEKEFLDQFERHFKALPEEARAVFALKELEGLSYDEIAETLHIRRGTVSSRLFYARERLRNAMSPYLFSMGQKARKGAIRDKEKTSIGTVGEKKERHQPNENS